MKIAQITTVFPPFRGGMGQVPFHYADELYKLGVEVEVITPDYGRDKISTQFTVHYVKPFLKWGLGAFCPKIFRMLKNYDVIQLHYPAFGMMEVVWFWYVLFNKKAKLVVFYHMDNVGKGLLGVIFWLHNKFIKPLIMHSADVILVSSWDYAENSQIKNFLKKHKYRFAELPFGVTPKYTPGEKNKNLLNKFSIDSNKKIILFVGGMGPEHYFKGVEVLIEACAKLKDNSWHLVCVGKGSLINKYKEKAKKLGIASRVTFTDFQPDEQMPDWYRNAYITVLPSIDKSEAFGIVLVEAMACASPTIASNLPGVRTVVDDGKTGFVTQVNNTDDLAKKIDLLLCNPTLRNQLSDNAVEKVLEKYQWKKIVAKLLDIYRI